MVTAHKEQLVPNYGCLPEKKGEVEKAIKLAIKYGSGNPSENLYGAAWLTKHFPYVNSSHYAYLDSKDVTGVPANLDDYLSADKSNRDRMISSNKLLYFIMHGASVCEGLTMEEFKTKYSKCEIRIDNIADITTKAENTKNHETACETLSLNEVSKRMLSEIDSSGSGITNHLGNIAMRASNSEMDIFHKKLLQKSRTPGSCLFVSIDIKGWT